MIEALYHSSPDSHMFLRIFTPFMVIRILIITNSVTGFFSNYLQVISKRNAAMHSSTLSFADDQLQESFTLIIDFMQKIHDSLSTLKEVEPVKKEIEKTTDNLKEVRDAI